MTEEERRRLAQISINTQPRDAAQLPADNVNRSILSQGVPPFPAGAQAAIAKPEVPATTGVATGELRGRDAISGGRMGMDRTPIQTPFGTIYATEQQQKNLAAAQTRQEDRQMALARASEAGFLIGQRLQDESTQRGYLFRQRLAEAEAQRELTPAFGGGVTRGAAMRGAQAQVEAERWKQAQAGRSPMSQEPLEVRGLQFRQTGMGQFAPIRGLGNDWATNFVAGGPQPARSTQQAASSPMAIAQPSFWQTVSQAMPSATAPVQFPSTPMTGAMSGTQFASRLVRPEEDRLRGLTTAMGVANRRRTGPLPIGLRGVI